MKMNMTFLFPVWLSQIIESVEMDGTMCDRRKTLNCSKYIPFALMKSKINKKLELVSIHERELTVLYKY